MSLHGFHNLFMAPFPHCFVKQQNKSILVYSTSKEELIEFSDEASLILIQELYKNISLYKAFKRLAAKLRIPLKQLVEEADELIAYLKSVGIIAPKDFFYDDEKKACLNLIGQMPGHFLSHVRNTGLSHLESPVGIRLQLTSACVVGCPHCYLRGSPHLNPNPENSISIPLNTIEEVIEQLLPKGLAYVQLSGGEPCLHENFDDICIYLLDKGIPVYVLTSGIGYDIQHVWRKIAGHKQKNRIFVQVSIDNYDTNSLCLQRPNANITTIVNLIDFLIGKEISVQSNTVITKDNYGCLEHLAKWLRQSGVQKMLFSMCKPAGNFPEEGFKKALSVHQYLECKRQLLSINQLDLPGDKISITFLDMPFFEDTSIGKEGDNYSIEKSLDKHCDRIVCSAGIIESVITPNCSVAPCAELSPFEDMCFGNLKQSPFLKVWNNGDTFYDIRNVICCEECRACNYADKCGKGCHATKKALGMDLNNPDPYCFYLKNEDIKWDMANKILPRSYKKF